MTGVPERDDHLARLLAALLVGGEGKREGFRGGEQVEDEEGGGDISLASPPILACQLDTRALQAEGARGRRGRFPKNLLPMIAGGGIMW